VFRALYNVEGDADGVERRWNPSDSRSNLSIQTVFLEEFCEAPNGDLG
jgi:hypothetical protein